MSLQFQQQQPTYEYPQLLSCDTCPNTNETWLKAFLINDEMNRNYWHIPQEALQKYVDGFKGRPLVNHPSGDHPNYKQAGLSEHSPTFIRDMLNFQDQFKIGDIVDVKYESLKDNPDKQAYFAYIRLTNPEYLNAVKQGATSFYVSPLIYDLDEKMPGESTTNFFPLHLAVVDHPAYGNIARVKASCNGENGECINALKKASIEEQEEDKNSYFVKSAANLQYRNNMPQSQQSLDPNYPGLANLAQILEAAGINPNQLATWNTNTNSYEPISTTSKTVKVKKTDAQGNLITETQDFKTGKNQSQQQGQLTPSQGQFPQQSEQTQQQLNREGTQQYNSSSLNQRDQQQQLTNQPAVTQQYNNQQDPASTIEKQSPFTNNPNPLSTSSQPLPDEVLQRLKEFDNIKSQFEDFKKFKQTQEERQMMEASEAQRQTIDTAFVPLFPDDGERQQVTDFFVSLNIDDTKLQALLDFVINGTLNTSDTSPAAANKQAAPSSANKGKVPAQFQKGAAIEEVIPVIAHTRRKGGIKGASLIMSENNPSLTYDENGNMYVSGKFSKGFLGDINFENLL